MSEEKERSGKPKATVPGAVSSGPPNLSDEAPSRGDQEHSKARSTSDKKPQSRGGPTTLPGAVSSGPPTLSDEAPSRGDQEHTKAPHQSAPGTKPQSRADQERNTKMKAKATSKDSKSSAGASGVGAHQGHSDTARRKEERNRNRGHSRHPEESKTKMKEAEHSKSDSAGLMKTAPLDEGYAVEAMAVDDIEADDRVRKLEAQMAAMMQSNQTSVSNVTVAQIYSGDDNNMAGANETVEENREQPCMQKYRFWILAAVVVAIAGGVAGSLLSRGSEATTEDSINPAPTNPPNDTLKYDPPSEAACSRLLGETIVETEFVHYIDLTFAISLAQPLTDAEVEKSLAVLSSAISERLIPLFVGCTVDPPSSTRRQLASNRLRYMIADATMFDPISLQGEEDACGENSPTPCFLALTNMDFFLKGDETAFSLLELISDVFAEKGEESLALPSDVVTKIRLQSVQYFDISDTDAPTSPPATNPTILPMGTDAPVNPPAISPTMPVATTSPLSKLEYLETLLSEYQRLEPNVVAWLTEVDTWEPTGHASVKEQWAERYAIASIYEFMDGGAWTSQDGWKSSSHICQGWFGITCFENRVTELDLLNNSLSEFIPTELGILNKVSYLDLSQNDLLGDIPTEIGMMTDMFAMNLAGSDENSGILDGAAIPSEIGLMTALDYFGLWNTNVTGTLPSEIGNLVNMVECYAWNTNMYGSIPTEIGRVVRLENLEIDQNFLTGTIPTEIGNLASLVNFYMWGNELQGPIPSEIGKLADLEVLQLGENMLTGSIPASIVNLSNLGQLMLQENELIGSVPILPQNVSSDCDLGWNCFSDFANADDRQCYIFNECN